MKSVLLPAKQAVIAVALAFPFLPAGAQSPSSDMPPRLEKIDELQSQSTSPVPAAQASEPNPPGRQIIEKRERGQFT
ncbi:MAG: hypothetical protein ACO1NO_09695, partial [Burkholderiaceae bacterium]